MNKSVRQFKEMPMFSLILSQVMVLKGANGFMWFGPIYSAILIEAVTPIRIIVEAFINHLRNKFLRSRNFQFE